MNWFNNVTIGKKLTLYFGSLAAFMVVLGVFSIAQMKKINGSTVDIAANWLPSVKVLGEMQYTASTIRRSELGLILETAPPRRAAWRRRLSPQLGGAFCWRRERILLLDS